MKSVVQKLNCNLVLFDQSGIEAESISQSSGKKNRVRCSTLLVDSVSVVALHQQSASGPMCASFRQQSTGLLWSTSSEKDTWARMPNWPFNRAGMAVSNRTRHSVFRLTNNLFNLLEN